MANDLSGPGDSSTPFGDVPPSPNVKVWIEADGDAPPGCGRIMVSLEGAAASEPPGVVASAIPYLSRLLGVLSPSSPKIVGNLAVVAKVAANDNVFWVGDDDEGSGGVFGSDVDAMSLADGSAVVAWVGDDRVVHARHFPADDTEAAQDATAASSELNKLLADLGDAGQAGSGPGRLKVVPLGQNGFAAFWIADFTLTAALIGKAFLSQNTNVEGQAADAPASGWSVANLEPAAVPKGASGISVAQRADNVLDVTVTTTGANESGAGAHTGEMLLSLALATGEDQPRLFLAAVSDDDAVGLPEDGPVTQVGHGSATPLRADAAGSTGQSAGDGAVTVTPASLDTNSGDGATAVAIPGDMHTGIASSPQVVMSESGNPFVLLRSPGATPGTETLTIVLLDGNAQPLLDADGTPRETTVTESAVTSDPERPYLDLEPSVTGTDTGASVAWVQAGATGALELRLQVYDQEGEALCGEATVVTMTSEQTTSFSDFDLAYTQSGVAEHDAGQDARSGVTPASAEASSPADDSAAASPTADGDQAPATTSADAAADPDVAATDPQDASQPVVQVAIVWVENANTSGYGDIKGQRYELDKGNSGGNEYSFVALGCDGEKGGDNDSAFNVGAQSAADQAAFGRAPEVDTAGDDTLVITWVRETSPGSGVEVIDGKR